jgi:hypothetical protein
MKKVSLENQTRSTFNIGKVQRLKKVAASIGQHRISSDFMEISWVWLVLFTFSYNHV